MSVGGRYDIYILGDVLCSTSMYPYGTCVLAVLKVDYPYSTEINRSEKYLYVADGKKEYTYQ